MIYKRHFETDLFNVRARVTAQRGFSLIEALISAIILGTGLISLGLFQSVVLKNSTLTKQRIVALNLAQEHLENMHYVIAVGQHPLIAQAGTISKPEKTAEYTLSWNTGPLNIPASTQINIKVTWPDFSKQGRITQNTTLYLSSIIAHRTPYALSQTSFTPSAKPVLPTLNFK